MQQAEDMRARAKRWRCRLRMHIIMSFIMPLIMHIIMHIIMHLCYAYYVMMTIMSMHTIVLIIIDIMMPTSMLIEIFQD